VSAGVRPFGVLECVVNISEGTDQELIAMLAEAAGPDLLDVHSDRHHNRSVFTLIGERAPRALAEVAVQRLDLRAHRGVHPRLGIVDVVPFVALGDSSLADARAARDRFGTWAADALGVPCFVYGAERTLPDVRRGAFVAFAPEFGPHRPHPTAGATAVGARDLLVAYNIWLADADLAVARRIAREVRGGPVRAIGLAVGDRVQVSLNLIEPSRAGPAEAFDLVRVAARASGTDVTGAEVVGLVPAAVLEATDPDRWDELDLAPERTIEARLARHRG
jgi:glutamate formiminotransferase